MHIITLTIISLRRKFLFLLFLLLTLLGFLNTKAQTFPAGFSLQLVDSGLTQPTLFAFAPDGRLFVAEQTGDVRIIKHGSLLVRPFMHVNVSAVGERGLLGIAFDPNFIINNYLYLYYTLPSQVNNRISRFTASGDTVVPGSETVVLDLDSLQGVNHNGGVIQFAPDGTMYVGVGENNIGPNAQDLDTYFGKVLHINSDGSVPPSNPYTTGSPQRQRVWSYGMRNPYTIAIHPVTGKIFVNDPGASSWEEVNDCSTGGNNYGWPADEGMSTNPAFTNPIYVYPHGSAIGEGCAITGGTFFNPDSTNYPALYVGNYFFLDFCNGWIDMLTINGTNITHSNFASGIAGYHVGMVTGPDGNLYFASRNDGAIYKIVYGNAPVTTRLNTIADAYVREGVFSNINYGSVNTLYTRVDSVPESNYETFLRFDLTSFTGAVSSALLRVYGGLNNNTIPELTIEAHYSTDTIWQENTVTWDTKPMAQPAILDSTTVSGTVKEFYEWNITPLIIALKNAGATAVTIKLNNTSATPIRALFNSKEASQHQPQLVIAYTPGSPTIVNTPPANNGLTDFDIFPNPSGNVFNLTLRNRVGDAWLKIQELQGRTIMQKLIENSIERINAASLSNGVYLITISDATKTITKKIIINK